MPNKPYKVLATKYRPVNFDSLVGQDVLVRTLTNSINNNRIANAFLLTGIRGVGKTTTARIIARALNCVGADGKGSATIKPCGVCSNCTSIMEDRHPDVIEMDAASRTGVDDIREVIDNTHYMPLSARYKVYIIDEVHMLSKNAFNALLKTLEEPPSHVKFIFATTEIRKIPVTILSRCQRFDLKRIEVSQLANHIGNIAAKEDVLVQMEALNVIASSAEGSVRDALSLLDQVIAHASSEITAQMVRDVLGLSDKSKVIELFTMLAKGDVASAFGVFNNLYNSGGDPVLIFNDLLEFTYLVTRMKAAPNLDPGASIPETELLSARELGAKLDISYLTRLWQLLLKGLEEIKIAPDSFAAAEMIMVRIAYMSDLPSPAKVIKDIADGNNEVVNRGSNSAQAAMAQNSHTNTHSEEPSKMGQSEGSSRATLVISEEATRSFNAKETLNPDASQEVSESSTATNPESFLQMVDLFKSNGEALLYNWLVSNVRLVKFEQGRVEISICESLPADFAIRLADSLKKWTGARWLVIISKQQGKLTIQEEKQVSENKLKEDLSHDPEISKVLEMFPGAVINKVG